MRAFVIFAGLLVACAAAEAAETITYSYDARGRLIGVAHGSGPNAGLTTSYTFDDADNRVTKATAAAPPAPPSFSVGNASATEGGTLAFSVTKSGTTSSSFSVNYATANGSAIAASDYTAKSGTLTFTSAQASQTVNVATINNTTPESTESMELNLSGATGGATISDATGIGTITDNDSSSSVSFSINNALVTEGGNLVFTVTKTGTTSSSFTVNYATADGTAVQPADYTAKSGTLSFTASATTRTVSISTNLDARVNEASETMLVNLSGASGTSTISDAQGVGTIINDDCPNPTTC